MSDADSDFVPSTDPWWKQWDPNNITVAPTEDDDDYDGPSDSWKYCVIQGVYFGGNDYNGWLGARISSIFVILFVSTACTLFPVVSKRVKWLKVHKYVYQFARNFGTGVIVATAYIHLLDPAYTEIGGLSCVGSNGNWSTYAWCPAIILFTVMLTFLVDVTSSFYVERKYGYVHNHRSDEIEDAIVGNAKPVHDAEHHTGAHMHESDEGDSYSKDKQQLGDTKSLQTYTESDVDSVKAEMSFKGEFAAFLILEFGILFHSVMIGLNLGTTGDEFKVLYPVLVFHQSFEGLGIGARLSMIEFPRNKRWWPYVLCIAYGLTTPVCVAIGLGVREKYSGNSYAVNVVSGVLDAISAGVLMYTGLVELLARDYIFNPNRTKSIKEMLFSLWCMFWGAGLMALLGKWA
ncbi:hypothetical protein HG535_0D06210 [Zygotorulaspora mrakii]|uniref:Zinc-regulated transporter 1 n=1 Tax=Zygotorulaspora mrakii TaxID=42260 RepID=A0A7H9B572_ZYGMR|nr:uncharacterized protein HG535_0D06210 [Zygotorulaspora mrakii]QLG72912.1 hypothetical protein HG535_0D06210 [Zygotorulaspora mrakii]